MDIKPLRPNVMVLGITLAVLTALVIVFSFQWLSDVQITPDSLWTAAAAGGVFGSVITMIGGVFGGYIAVMSILAQDPERTVPADTHERVVADAGTKPLFAVPEVAADPSDAGPSPPGSAEDRP